MKDEKRIVSVYVGMLKNAGKTVMIQNAKSSKKENTEIKIKKKDNERITFFFTKQVNERYNNKENNKDKKG